MAIIEGRRLDVRADSPYRPVAERRRLFNVHVDTCTGCQPQLCSIAQAMWRNVCLSALRASDGGA